MSYYRSTYGGGNYWRANPFGGFSFFPPVIKWLLVSNAVIWLITDLLLSGSWLQDSIVQYLALMPLGSGYVFPWQLITYLFLHGDFLHLFFNMLGLWMFGMELENVWGSKKFLTFYIVCGVGAGISNLLLAPIFSQAAPTVGASGSVFGVLTAFGMMFPDRMILLYFLVPVKAKFFVAGYIALELLYLTKGTSRGIAHVAHLGGALVGFLMMIGTMRGWSFSDWWKKITGGPRISHDPRRARKAVREEVYDAKFFDINTGSSIEGDESLNQEVIDAILDKINRSGYQSLSAEEKRILNEASKKIN